MTTPPKTVLVVDDEPTNRVLLRALLKRAGYVVVEAENGVTCLEYLNSSTPDAVLLDVMMPELDGLTVCRRVRENLSREELPILLVTTLSEGEHIAEGLAAGANDYIAKPIDREVLLARLESQLALAESRRKLAEQQQALAHSLVLQNAIADVLPDALAVHDREGRLLHVNQPLLSAYTRGVPQTIQDVFSGLFEGLVDVGCRKGWKRIEQQPDAELNYEISISRGPISHVQVVSRPVVLVGVEGVRLWLWRDLSGQRELEKLVNQRVRLETVGIFASGVAHNFNNFLGSIVGATDLLSRLIPDDPKLKKCVEVIRKAVLSSTRLTKRISRLGTRRGAISLPVGVSIAKVVDTILRDDYPAESRGFQFVSVGLDDLPRVALTEEALHDILSNVISNAVDALREGGSITVEAAVSGEGALVDLAVTDTGIGMDEAVLQRVFEPFFTTKKLDEVNGVSTEGHGLGLWNTYHVLKVAGGDVRIHSVPGVGTTVTVQLPVMQEQAGS